MASPRQYYKSAHPTYFSDSLVEETTELDRSLLEFHLDTLTSRSQEMDFERFARKLCEREICPNLIPTTGPTGGGDSKADSETFPVSDRVALQWYGGLAREANAERWAFAFSTKKTWLPKVQSDVAKIVETQRDYAKIFFVTNQAISSKRRSAAEDALTKKHGVEVRIFDRTWILERVFTGHHEPIAIAELKVTGLSKQHTRTGPGDTVRIAELENLEKRIRETIQSNWLSPELVDNAIEAADICRSLEKSRFEVEGAYGRADNLALKYGMQRQQVESVYQWAWTLFWWYEDFEATAKKYDEVEQRALPSENVFDLSRLVNLWSLLSVHLKSEEWFDLKTPVLKKALARLAEDHGRPSTSLEATSLGLQIELRERLIGNVDPATIFEKFEDVILKSQGLIGFPMRTLVKTLSAIGEAYGDSPAYDHLLQVAVEAASKREGEVRAARLLLDRGEQLMDLGKHVRAIALVGQALGRLYKHETRRDIVFALYLCAAAYERIGLLWAARGTFLSGATVAANEFWRHGEIGKGFAVCVAGLKWVELYLGRISQSLAWHELDLVLRERLSLAGVNQEPLERRDLDYQLLFARHAVKIPWSTLPRVASFPDTLDHLGLDGAASMVLFLLGYEERVREIAEDGDANRFATTLWNLQSDVQLPNIPELYEAQRVTLSTKVLGCTILIDSQRVSPCIEIAECLLATIESFLSTSSLLRAHAFEPVINVVIDLNAEDDKFLTVTQTHNLGVPLVCISCSPFNPNEPLGEAEGRLQGEIFDASVVILCQSIQFGDLDADLAVVLKEEKGFERAVSFTGPIGTLRNVLGLSPKMDLQSWLSPSNESYPLKRKLPWEPLVNSPTSTVKAGSSPITYGQGEPPADLLDPNKISHQQMEVMSPIRNHLWENAGWTGAFYQTYEGNPVPPILGLLFTNREVAREIFANWREEYGEVDEHKKLRISIVRGVDRAHPHKYRLIIGLNPIHFLDDNRYLMVGQRVHTMEASSPVNLQWFLDGYEKHHKFVLCATYMRNGHPEIEPDAHLGLYDLSVRNAWEIGMNDPDLAGILLDDDIIVPDGIDNPPCAAAIKWRRTS